MRALIPTTSPLYAKRLVKEIRSIFNKAAEGVYLNGDICRHNYNPRITSVRFSGGNILAKSGTGPSLTVYPDQWAEAFFDGYGRTIYASRHANASYGCIQAK